MQKLKVIHQLISLHKLRLKLDIPNDFDFYYSIKIDGYTLPNSFQLLKLWTKIYYSNDSRLSNEIALSNLKHLLRIADPTEHSKCFCGRDGYAYAFGESLCEVHNDELLVSFHMSFLNQNFNSL